MTPAGGRLRPVVFLHGLGGSAADWKETAAALGKGPHVLAWDLPGFAGSPKPREGYDPASLARWLAAALDREKAEKPLLVGHSIGARVAGELAALEPARPSGLALVSPLGAAGYGIADKLKWRAMSRASVVASTPESTLRRALGYGFAVDGPAKRAFVERGLKARSGAEGQEGIRAMERCVDGVLGSPPLKDRLRGCRVPILVVSGEEDPLTPTDEAATILRACPDADHAVLPGVGHYPHLESPKALGRLLLDFLLEL